MPPPAADSVDFAAARAARHAAHVSETVLGAYDASNFRLLFSLFEADACLIGADSDAAREAALAIELHLRAFAAVEPLVRAGVGAIGAPPVVVRNNNNDEELELDLPDDVIIEKRLARAAFQR